MGEKKNLLDKVKEHKTEIIIAGIAIVSIAGVILLAKNQEVVSSKNMATRLNQGMKIKADAIPAVQVAMENVAEIDVVEKIVDVSKHLRTLPTGRNASPAKLLTASENGFRLEIGQTWVDKYSKKCA